MRRSTRRELIGTAAIGAAALAGPPAWARQLSSRAAVGFGNFRDGVASGEPSAAAVTLWSRLATDHLRSGARLTVATDPGMRHVVATRVVPTGRAINGTLKARVGRLRPSHDYYYVWESRNDVSPIGRTRTSPHPHSDQPLQIAFSSCQNYGRGYFSPHAHAATQDLDLYVFLGDYIYAEDIPASPDYPRFDPINGNDLRSYRRKYKLYRSDAGLRELHRQHPAVHVWDDHEIENNYTDNRPAPSPLQRTAGYRAAFEWIPRTVDPSDRFRIYKRIPLGRMADLFVIDERQYRAVDAADKPLKILGDTQMQWLIAGLKASTARWKVIANEVVIAPMNYGTGARLDAWNGYENSRALLLGEIERAGIQNVVFISGDEHVYMVNALASDAETFRTDPTRRPSAIEYVGGSVTSPGTARTEADVRARNPWNRQFNSAEHGYAHMTLDATQLVTEYRRSDLWHPDGATMTFERFTQPAGTNELQRESFPPPA